MNREIKFRVWYEKDKQMIDWFSLTQNAWNTFRGEQPLSLIYEILVARKDDFNVMQYTGLKDKNGVEIYKEDIFKDVLNSDQIGVVKFGEYNHCFDDNRVKTYGNHIGFYVDFNDSKIRKDLKYWSNHSFIIGNIHENPELLNQPI